MATENPVQNPYAIDHLDFETACDFGEPIPGQLYNAHLGAHDDPARWILYKRHTCGRRAMVVCNRCKATLYDAEGCISCTWCDAVVNNREFYSRCERLSKA